MTGIYIFQDLLPSYFTGGEKGRIAHSLKQFHPSTTEINYSGFYIYTVAPYFMASDILHSVKGIDWNPCR